MDAGDAPSRIEACLINHDTSAFAELAIRSFAAMHRKQPDGLDLSLTIVDNHSQDDGLADLKAAAAQLGVPIVPSRWPPREARCNTHGDVLRDFVLDRREADMFLFIDFIHADVRRALGRYRRCWPRKATVRSKARSAAAGR